jgi:hypothetical protein
MLARNDPRPYGLKFRVRLVEEHAEGQYRPAPWRNRSVALAAKRLQTDMDRQYPASFDTVSAA